MMKKAQQMRTMFPMGLSDEIRVSTTNLRPGARLMTLDAEHRHVPDPSPAAQAPPPPPRPCTTPPRPPQGPQRPQQPQHAQNAQDLGAPG